MYTHMLVATDGSKLSGKAVAQAIALAQALSAKLTAFYASPDYPMPAFSDGVVYDPISRKDYAAMALKEAERDPRAGEGEGRGRRHRMRDDARDLAGAVGGDPRRGEEDQMRRDRDGLARPQRPAPPCCSAARRRRC